MNGDQEYNIWILGGCDSARNNEVGGLLGRQQAGDTLKGQVDYMSYVAQSAAEKLCYASKVNAHGCHILGNKGSFNKDKSDMEL